MYSLILDSSTSILYVCLVKNKTVLYEVYLKGNRDHAKNIVLKIEEALTENNLTTADLDEVICGVGPGSYTGVRMAVTVSKMLSSLGDITLKRISTLLLMSSGTDKISIPTIDARRGNVFSAKYDNMSLVEEEALRNKEAFFDDELPNPNESDFKVNPLKVISYAKLVEEPDGLVPNYLRITEAERSLHDKENGMQ